MILMELISMLLNYWFIYWSILYLLRFYETFLITVKTIANCIGALYYWICKIIHFSIIWKKISIQNKQKPKCKQKNIINMNTIIWIFVQKNKFNTMPSTLTIWITTLTKKKFKYFFCNCNEIIEMGWWEYVL